MSHDLVLLLRTRPAAAATLRELAGPAALPLLAEHPAVAARASRDPAWRALLGDIV